jgi:aspartate/methionine/tyrosine aminotransferase
MPVLTFVPDSSAATCVAVVPLSPFADIAPPRHMIRLCFAKRDETIEQGIAALAKARELAQ